jgi:glycosyltransferase involved in cell wall biosynthesis
MSTLSVVINTKNEAKNIKRALSSVKKIADEIIVVDMMSDDGTPKIAKEMGAKVFEYKKEHGFADPARNFALTKASGDWVLILDADEEISKKLSENITKLIESEEFDAYFLPRKNIIFDKWIEYSGWWPDYQPRLFKKGHLEWPGKVHAQPIVKGGAKHLPAKQEYAITHYNYTDIEQYLDKLNRYTTLTAKSSFDKKMATPISAGQVFEKFNGEFLSRFFAHEGIKDGVHGMSLSLLQSMYELVVFLKVWELGDHPSLNADQSSGIGHLRKFQKDLNYWIADHGVKNSWGLKKIYWQIRRKFKI